MAVGEGSGNLETWARSGVSTEIAVRAAANGHVLPRLGHRVALGGIGVYVCSLVSSITESWLLIAS